MTFNPQVYPMSFSSNHKRDELENSSFALLPPEILAHDSSNNIQNSTALFFALQNGDNTVHVGVYEFTDIPDVCFIPYYYMVALGIKEGERISINRIEEPSLAEHIVLTPHEHAFIELPEPKTILEHSISVHYPILSEGGTIRLEHDGTVYSLSVTELRPNSIAKMINCDVNLEFTPALDYTPPVQYRDERSNNIPFYPFGGMGHRLGSIA